MTKRSQRVGHQSNRARRSRPPLNGTTISGASDEACRQDFVSFARMCFDILTPAKSFLMNWHIEAIAYLLEQAFLGKCRRLIINLPPRYSKSLMASVAFPAFLLGHDPTKRVIVASYSSDLAVNLANNCRAILNSPRYKSIWPALQISRVKNTETEIVTSRGGCRLAVSIDGSVTGRGADVIIIDDPLKPSDASSDAKRDHVNEWYRNTLLSRLDDKQKGVIIIVMQRLHEDDLCGFVLKNSKDWTVLDLSAIARKDVQIQIGDTRFHHRKVGDVLHPERESKADLDKIRSELGEGNFAAQYQQCPSEPVGRMIKQEYIRRYPWPPLRDRSHYVIQSWDTAIGADGNHDYSVCATVQVERGEDQPRYYVVDIVRARLFYPELKALAIAQAKKHKPNAILVEKAGISEALIKAIGSQAVEVEPKGSKLMRVSLQLEKFVNGQVFFPKQASWLADLETELYAFPNGRYDDQIDALVQALAYNCPGFAFTRSKPKTLSEKSFGQLRDILLMLEGRPF
jgi:predicted phage terminase large subunit-like protein